MFLVTTTAMVIPVLYAKAFERIFSRKQNKPNH
jgi:hypothetical protein